jgi:RND family efflux transporter MFP subunit
MADLLRDRPAAAAAPPDRPTPTNRGVSVLLWAATATMVVLIVAVIAVGASRPDKPLEKPTARLANVEVQTIRVEPYDEALVLPAVLLADREATLSAELAGTLHEWLVKEGDQVAAGQVVARLNTDTLRAQQAELEAARRTAEATATMAERQLSLAKVSLEQTRRDLAQLEHELAAAQADLALAEKELARSQALRADNIQSQADYDAAANTRTQRAVAVERVTSQQAKARLAIESATVQISHAEASLAMERARVEEHAARLAQLAVSLAKTELRAPLAGRLQKFLLQAGEVVAPGQPLAAIYDLEYIRVKVDVADRFAPFLDLKSKAIDEYLAFSMPDAQRQVSASVILPGLPKLTGGTYKGLELPAELAYLAQASDPTSNTFQVELRLLNPGGALKQGIIGQARIAFLHYPKALVIPVRAVQVSDQGPRVLVAEPGPDGTATTRVRDIVPVSLQNDRILVSGGIAEGEHLIVAGGKGLVEGEAVRVIAADGQLLPQAARAAANDHLDAGAAGKP